MTTSDAASDHDVSRSANLEGPAHAADHDRVVAEAVDDDLTVDFVDRCGRGGSLTRVFV